MNNIPKGTKDVLPAESWQWQYLEQTARAVTEAYRFEEIRTPTFEHTEVFLRGIGDTTDVVNKEMYTFEDKGGRSVTLKPEGTAGVARSFVENLSGSALPVKLYYITPCFRYERPQAGRLREFHQFGVEFFGSPAPSADAEVILLARAYLNRLGVKELKLNLNSIGCKTCRKAFNEALKAYFAPYLNEMCENCRERFEKNPLRILDCKDERCAAIAAGAPVILDYLCADCAEHFGQVKELLGAAGVAFSVNPHIVRGLDYYTRTVFEFVSESIGAQGTVCGGGRYDGLIEEMGGASVPGVGFGLGLERLLLLMRQTGVAIPEKRPFLYVAPLGEEARAAAFRLTQELREAGVSAETDHMNRSVKAQFKYADKLRVRFVAVLGADELSRGEIKLRDMENGGEENVPLAEFVSLCSSRAK
jgi:histidine--tRNA ligase